jgi:hypothetical protein
VEMCFEWFLVEVDGIMREDRGRGRLGGGGATMD